MTLFAIVVNDIIKFVPRTVSCSLYVNDVTLYCLRGSLRDVQGDMQTAQWATYHGFKFSPRPWLCSIKGQTLCFVQEVKYLRLILDSRLPWVPHVKRLKVKATKALQIE